MGSCCSASDTADDAASAAPPTPRKTTAKPAIPSYSFPRRSIVDLIPPDPPWAEQPSVSASSVPRMYGTEEAPTTAIPAVGPPAAQTDRKILTSPPSQPFPTLHAGEENDSSGDSDADSSIQQEPLSTTKSATGTPAEIQIIAPAQQRSEGETAKQQLVAASAPTFSSADVTPERATAPMVTQGEGGCARCPSTAQVEEVPPTPKDESGKTLPADDARVLQRVPPPPPPAASTDSVTRKEPNRESEQRGVDEADQAQHGATDNAEQKVSVAAAKEDEEATEEKEPNLLAGMIRSQQEDQQRYPTALSIDADKDAPVEMGMGKDGSPSAAGAETHAKEGPKTSSPPPPEMVNDMNPNAYDVDEANPASEMPMAATVAPEQVDSPTSSSGEKIFQHYKSSALNKTEALHGISPEEVGGFINPITPEQQPQGAQEMDPNGIQSSPLACPIQELSQVEPISWSKASLLEGSPLHWETSHGADVSPRVYRPLRLGTDVLRHKRYANASNAADKIGTAAALSEFGSEETEVDDQGVACGLGDVVERPIAFTATSEVELECEAVEASNDEEGTLSMDKDRVYTMDNTDAEDRSQPRRTVESSAALGAPIEAADKHTVSSEQHAAFAMLTAEKSAWTGAEAPRRMPPPPPYHHSDEARDTQPPSRSAPPSILSPPPA